MTSTDLRERIRRARRIDVHNHVRGESDNDSPPKLNRSHALFVLEKCDKLSIDLVCVSRPLTTDSPTPDEFRRANDVILQAMDLSPRFLGFCFVNPGYAREAAAEIERCVAAGMVGVKLYHQYTICDPTQTAVAETAAGLGVPVLMHAGKCTDDATRARQPRLSNAAHFVKAAGMFPETTFIQGHIGGGGDWQWNLRVLETRPNTYIDTSGSVIDYGIVTKTVAALGSARVLFATDGAFEEGVGKVLDADITDDEKAMVFAENAKRILGGQTA